MNVPKTKKQRYKARKKQKLAQEFFGPGYKPPFTSTKVHFWKDIDIYGNNKQNVETKETVGEFIRMNTQMHENELDLTDDNSPSIPLAPTITQAPGIQQTLKKPSLNMQEKTQEKFKVNQKQNENQGQLKCENQNKEQNIILNEDLKIQNEMEIGEQNKNVDTKQLEINESSNKDIQNQDRQIFQKSDENKELTTPSISDEAGNRSNPNVQSMENEIKNWNIANTQPTKTTTVNKPANEGDNGCHIPVLSPKSHDRHWDQINTGVTKTIPTLTRQGTAKRAPVMTTNPVVNYQNVYNVLHQPVNMNQLTNAVELQQPYQNFYASEPLPPGVQMPSGVPLSFVMQQHNFGAIQPQQISGYIPNSPMPMGHVMPIQTNQPPFPQQMYMENHFVANTYARNELPAAIPSQPYSPSDLFTEDGEARKEEEREDSSSPDICEAGQRRLSAFSRLGPLAEPKKPKLTINLSFNKEQAVREVVGEKDGSSVKYVPVHLREDILSSTDSIVTSYLPHWPWKNRVVVRKSVGARLSKSAMLMEQEQMEEVYEMGNIFIQLTVKGYPSTWSKEDVLDTLLENLKGKSFIPCFIEFSPNECKFVVLRCRQALVAIHKMGFRARKDDVVLNIRILDTDLDIKTLNFIPNVILRERIMMGLEDDIKLNLKAFTIQPDVSHFIYYPLNRTSNQIGIVDINMSIVWKNLTHLVLSHNRITTIDGFDLQHSTPKLQDLDISHNNIERVTVLLNCRKLALKSLKLEGNPLCTDYRNPQDYIKVAKMLFPMLRELDGVPIAVKSDAETIHQNYCEPAAKDIVEKFLQTYFPLLESPSLDRALFGNMYDSNAILTVTYRPSLLNMTAFRKYRPLFPFIRKVGDKIRGGVASSKNIVKLIKKWPNLEHDPSTFTVDVMFHTESSTLIRIGGVMKITSESLAEEEYIFAFTKTILLHKTDGVEYKIQNDMLYWDLPTPEYLKQAFRTVPLPKKTISVALHTPPCEDTKDCLVNIFMKLTELDRPQSERYLQEKDWNIKDALHFFTQLFKLNSINMIQNTSSSELAIK